MIVLFPGPLSIFDFKEHVDQHTYVYVEPEKDKMPPDIYPYVAINDEKNGIKGSCSTYWTRKNITDETRSMSYDQVCESYEYKLVFVASQQLRTKYLIITKGQFIPTNFDLTFQAYCILERIGRCRHYGCIDISTERIPLAPKDVFYRRKELMSHKLITKQSISKQKKKGIMRYNLYYLTRYHIEHKSKVINLMQTILETLRASSSTDYILPLKHFNDMINISALSVKKLLNYFRLEDKVKEVELPYSQVFPNLPLSQCLTSQNKERQAICIQLLDTDINIEKELNKVFDNIEDEGSEEDEEEEDIEECEEEEKEEDVLETRSQQSFLSLIEALTTINTVSDLSDSESLVSSPDKVDSCSSDEELAEETMEISFLKRKGFLIENTVPVDMSMRKQMLKVVEQAGFKGCSALHIQKEMKLVRTDIRSLVKHNATYLHTFQKDEGRQRTQHLRLKQYSNSACEEFQQGNSISNSICGTPFKKLKLENKEVTDLNKTISQNSVNPDISIGILQSLNSVRSVLKETVHPRGKSLSKLFSTDLQHYRVKYIIEFFNKNPFIVGYSTILNLIIQNDKDRHVSSTCDKKTVIRMLEKLANEGYIKIVDITFQIDNLINTQKNIRVYAHCDVNTENKDFKKLIETEKLKFSEVKISYTSRAKVQNENHCERKEQFKYRPMKDEKFVAQTEFDSNSIENENTIDFNDQEIEKSQSLIEQSNLKVELKTFESITVEIRSNVVKKRTEGDIKQLYPTSLMNDRAADCLEFIQQKRITVGFRDVLNFVIKRDKERNYDARVDHRTIKRLLEKMSCHNFIKCFHIQFKNVKNSAQKDIVVYSVLDMTSECAEFNVILDKERLLFWGENSSQPTKAKAPLSSEYTMLCKFAKMEKMHMLAFYVTYSSVKPVPDQDLARRNLELKTHIKIPANHPVIYNDTDLNDFTFLPTLPPPPLAFPKGFIDFQDFFSLIPIGTLLQSLRTTMFVKELAHYYHDPVKRFYPIKDTSPDAYTILTRQNAGRKNVSSVYQIFSNLALLGLIQFGKKFGTEKEKFAMYINKKSTLVDTTTSKPAYMQLEPQKTGVSKIHYNFFDITQVKKYWQESCHICTNTPLGVRTIAVGQKVKSYKNVIDKPSLAQTVDHYDDPNIILSRDNGQIPGDGLGAAGYDSGIFAHLKRNWASIAKTLTTSAVVKVNRGSTKPSKLFRVETTPQNKRNTGFVERIVNVRKNSKKKKSKPIEKTSALPSSMSTPRTQVKWTNADSDILHIIHALYKTFKVKPCHKLTRDILVKIINKKSRNKDLSARMLLSYYRRVLKITENKERCCVFQAEISHRSQVKNFLLPYIKNHGELGKNQKTEAHRYFFDNVLEIVKNVYEMVVLNKIPMVSNELPTNYDQFLTEYRIMDFKENFTLYPVPNTSNNIKLNVLLNLIHSSLASSSDVKDDNMRHCLFDAYQRYPESLINKAIRILKKCQIIASSKFITQHLQQTRIPNKNPTPLAITRFKLSSKYIYKLNLTEMQFSSIHESFIQFNVLATGCVHNIVQVDSGCFTVLSALLGENNITLDIQVPNTLLLLDPKIEKINKSNKDIVDRYYQLVDHYKVGTMEKNLEEDEDNDDEDYEKEASIPPMNLFNAARLAMYTLKDVLLKEKINAQHVHKLLTLNTCKILLSGVNSIQDQYDKYKSEAYIEKLSEQFIVPKFVQEQMDTIMSSGWEKQVAAFIESKMELGATSEDIRVKYGATLKVKSILDSLVDKRVVIRTGTILPTYVHNKYCRLWLVKTTNKDEIIETAIAPWVHVNGILNRPVLDYMLSVLLSHILFNPGVTLLYLQEHFASIIQPTFIITLLDILVHFQCVSIQVVTIVKSTLFTKGSVYVSRATGLEPSDLIHVEAFPNAALKLGMFIGEKSYDHNFLSIVTSKQADTDFHDTN